MEFSNYEKMRHVAIERELISLGFVNATDARLECRQELQLKERGKNAYNKY